MQVLLPKVAKSVALRQDGQPGLPVTVLQNLQKIFGITDNGVSVSHQVEERPEDTNKTPETPEKAPEEPSVVIPPIGENNKSPISQLEYFREALKNPDGVTRGEIMEHLWPGVDYRAGNQKVSVLVSSAIRKLGLRIDRTYQDGDIVYKLPTFCPAEGSLAITPQHTKIKKEISGEKI